VARPIQAALDSAIVHVSKNARLSADRATYVKGKYVVFGVGGLVRGLIRGLVVVVVVVSHCVYLGV
jgi:hypothetical protein